MSVSMVCLSLAVRVIPIGTAYAVWTGIGAAGAAIMGMILFNEPRDAARSGVYRVDCVGSGGVEIVYACVGGFSTLTLILSRQGRGEIRKTKTLDPRSSRG